MLRKKVFLRTILLLFILFPATVLFSACGKELQASNLSGSNKPIGIQVVSAPRPLDDVEANGHRVRYFQGETEFDFNDLIIEVNLPGQESFTENVTYGMIQEFAVEPFDTSELGLQEFTIRWGEFRTSFQILVEQQRAEYIAVTVAPRITYFNLYDKMTADYKVAGDDIREGMEVTVKMNNEPEERILRGADVYKYVEILPSSFENATSQSGVNRRVFVNALGARTSYTVSVMNTQRGKYTFEGIYLNEEYAIDTEGMKKDIYGSLKPLLHDGLTSMINQMLNDRSGKFNRAGFIDALLYASEVNETVQEALDILAMTYFVNQKMTLPSPNSSKFRDTMDEYHEAGLVWAASQADDLLDTIIDVIFNNSALDDFLRGFIGDDIIDVISTVTDVLGSLGIEIAGKDVIIDLSGFETLSIGNPEIDDVFELVSQLSGSFEIESTDGTRNDKLCNFEFTTLLGVVFSYIEGVSPDIIPDFVDVFLFARENAISLGIGIEKIEIDDWYLPIDLSLGIGFGHEDKAEPDMTVTAVELNQRTGNLNVTRNGYKYVEYITGNDKVTVDATVNMAYYDSGIEGIPAFAVQMREKVMTYGVKNATFGLSDSNLSTHENLFSLDANAKMCDVNNNLVKNDQPLLRILREYLMKDYERTDRQNIFMRKVMTGEFLDAQGICLADEIHMEALTQPELSGGIGATFGKPALRMALYEYDPAWWTLGLAADKYYQPRSNQELITKIFDDELVIDGKVIGISIQRQNVSGQIYEGFVDQLVEQLTGLSYHKDNTFGVQDTFQTYKRYSDPKTKQPQNRTDGKPMKQYLGREAYDAAVADGTAHREDKCLDVDLLLTSDLLDLINMALDLFMSIQVRNDGKAFVELINNLLAALLQFDDKYVTGDKTNLASPKVTFSDMFRLGVEYNNGVVITMETVNISVDMPVAEPFRDWASFPSDLDRPDTYWGNKTDRQFVEYYSNGHWKYLLGYMHNNPNVRYLVKDADGNVIGEEAVRIFTHDNATKSGTTVDNNGIPYRWEKEVVDVMGMATYKYAKIENPFQNIVYKLNIPHSTVTIKFGERGLN
ncbi:MAG: hypothetical protein LBG88_03675 [Christensenellaceae bacterium]|jgi:hypothetical protein|nr:hypothetical protein [Christensenellaceae bacterium]